MKRNYGIDALRIVSIFMVIILHVMAQGAAIYSVDKGSVNYYIFWFLEMASFCAVNCFALVSGYVGYGREKKPSAIISLSAQALFYVIVFTAAGLLAKGAFDKEFVLASLLSVREGGFWYFKAYLCAWFFFPCIDIAVEKLEKKQLKRMVVAGFIFFSIVPLIFFADLFRTGLGYTPLWLLVMYFYGAYVKKYGIDENKKSWKYFLLFLLSSVITWAGVIAIKSVEGKVASAPLWLEHFMSFTSPTVVLSGVFLFFAFANIKTGKIANAVIKFVSPLTFGIYLVHTQYAVWKFIEEKFMWTGGLIPIYATLSVLGVSVGIFIVCAMVEYVRKLIFKITGIDSLIKKADKK